MNTATVRRPALALALAAILLGPLAWALPAQAAMNYRIDSIAGCQRFLDAMGADLGLAAPGLCEVSSQFAGALLPAGATVTIARGWSLHYDSLYSANAGTIVNYGSFSAAWDVFANEGDGRFVNHGTVTSLGGSGFDFRDQSRLYNATDGTIYLRGGGMGVADTARAVNRGRILVGCDPGSLIPGILGNQPVVQPCGPAPRVVASWPKEGAGAIPVDIHPVVRFSEPVAVIGTFAYVWCEGEDFGHPAIARKIDSTTYRLHLLRGPLPVDSVCHLHVSGRLVANKDLWRHQDTAPDYAATFTTA